MKLPTLLTGFLWLIITTCIFIPTSVYAQYDPPENVTLTMYQLAQGSGASTGIPCTKDEPEIAQSYGCTAITEGVNRTPPYPFNSSTITIGIESAMVNGIQQGYLHNVLSTETPPENVHPVAVAAQAIVARTYAYWQIDFNQTYGINPIDNSASGFQVYVPFAYAALEPDEKQVVANALADWFYLSYATGPRVEDVFGKQFVREVDDPIFAEFNSESVEQTIDHPTNAAAFPYLHGVAEPISVYPTLDSTYQRHGFIQHGASRWAKGDVGWNLLLDRGQWSVRWTTAAQLLTHYYTGIHIRDAGNGNAVKTPVYRWAPLRIDAPTHTCTNANVPVTLWMQNTGTAEWAAHTIIAVITNLTATPAAVTTPQANEILTAVPVGDTVVITHTVRPTFAGAFTYSVDFYTAAVGFFSQQTPTWPRYEQFTPEAVDCQARLYLPMVQTGRITSAQAQSNQAATAILDQAQWLPLIVR